MREIYSLCTYNKHEVKQDRYIEIYRERERKRERERERERKREREREATKERE